MGNAGHPGAIARGCPPRGRVLRQSHAPAGLGGEDGGYPSEIVNSYRLQFADPVTFQAVCEDYRAGATIDREFDERDRGLLIECRLLVLRGSRGALPRLYDDVLGVWRAWTADVLVRELDATHFLAEDRHEELAAELGGFFTSAT